MRQTTVFLETDDYRVITVNARDGSGKTKALVQQRDPATDTWHDIRTDTRGVFLHVSPAGIEIHLDHGAAILLIRAHCNSCGEANPLERTYTSSVEPVKSWAMMHASFHHEHEVSIETWDAKGEQKAVTFRAPTTGAITPPKV